MRGLFELTRVDKKEDLWRDEYGNQYHHRGNDRFDLVNRVVNEQIKDLPTLHGCNRNCNWFEDYKTEQELMAQQKLTEILQGNPIEGWSLKEPFSFSINPTPRSEDSKLQKTLIYEELRAEKIMNDIMKNRR
jgi:hypothetical protein